MYQYPESKVHGANMGPSWVLSTPDGPHVSPMNLVIRIVKLLFMLVFSDITHDDVMKWKHFPRYWSFVQGIQRSPGNSPHKGQ